MLAENNDQDPILRHGGVMGLVGCATAQQIAGLTAAPVAVRGAATVALRRLKSPLVAEYLKDADETVVLDAARAVHDVPIDAAMPALASLTTKTAIKNPNILNRAVNAHYRLGGADHAKALAAFAADSSVAEGSRKDALDALTEWAAPNPKDRLLNQWRPIPTRGAEDAAAAVTATIAALLKDSPDAIREAVAKLAAKLSIATAGEPLFALASNERAGTNARVEAIKALAILKDKHLAQIAKLAVGDKNPKVRSEGLQALATTDPATAVKAIGHIVETGSVTERQGAVLALSQINSKEAEGLFLQLLDKLVAGQLAPEIQVDAIEAAKKQKSRSIQDKLARYEASLSPTDDLAKYRVALLGGDADRGRKIFREKTETQCMRCHKCEMGDSLVGPELTHIGSSRDRVYLLEAVVYPTKTIAPGFDTVILTLKDGNIVGGRLQSEDASTVKVETMDATGKPVSTTVPKANIKQRDSAPSAMPPGLGEMLTKSELRDVIEYLATRK
jgi:quinoprotein glucose dehydrogenase